MSRSDQQVDHITVEEKFFLKGFNFSYSGLNKLLFSPRLWYKHYVLQERQERTDLHLIEGKVIHALLLDEANFNKNFVVSPAKLPSEPTKSLLDKIFLEARAEGTIVDTPEAQYDLASKYNSILKGLKDINLHQSLKTDQQRLDKMMNDGNSSYWEFLRTKDGKDLLDQETFERCKEAVEIFRKHPKISDLLKLNNTNKKIDVYNEQPIERAVDGFPFGIKGIIDNFVIDHEAKTIYINDIKTTGKTIAEFQETIEYYNYWLQAAIYVWLTLGMFPEDYKLKFTFIVIDKYQQVYPFEVSPETGRLWNARAKEALATAKWHYENRKFNLPIKFEKETVIL